MKNIPNKLLIFFPFLLLCLVSYLKWEFFERSIFIFIIASGICFLSGSVLIIYSRLKFKARVRSLGATLISLLSMQKVPGFSLIIVAILAFTWLIDYVREFPVLEQAPNFLLAGAVFSVSLIFIVAVIVIFIEKRKLEQLKKLPQETPVKTNGLILSLSILANSAIIKENFKNIKQYSKSIREIFQIILNCKTAEEIENLDKLPELKMYADNIINLFKLLANTSIYPLLIAIEHHINRLEHVWILVTPSSEETALKIFEKLMAMFYSGVKLHKVDIENPDNVNFICKTVDEVYSEAQELYGYDEDDVTADITSGPASATAGIILACVRSKRQVQYLGKHSMNLQAIEVNVRSIPHLFDELIDQIELIRADDFVERRS